MKKGTFGCLFAISQTKPASEYATHSSFSAPQLDIAAPLVIPSPLLTSFGRFSASSRSYQRINSKLGKLVIRLVGVTAGKSIKPLLIAGTAPQGGRTPRSGPVEGLSERSECPQAALFGALAITALKCINHRN
ncbi:hypothetical protein [Aeromonas sobria]|uniref:hypothetical protein n=1 Tax=Aeromonas sobria TaxID=646 RepID=UPI003F2AA37F